MSQYNFVNPGAAAGSGILDVLAQARAEKRQKLIDQITAQNAASQRALESQQIEASKANETRIQHEQELQDLKTAETGVESGQDLSQHPLLPLFKKYGLVGGRPAGSTPSVSTTETVTGVQGQPDVKVEGDPTVINQAGTPPPPPAGTNYFVGSPEERKREKIQGRIGNLVSTLNDPKIPNWQRMLAIYGAMEQDIPANAATSMQPEKPMYTVSAGGRVNPITDPSTHQPLTATPGDSPIVRLPNPPEGHEPQYIGTNNDGIPVFAHGGRAFTTDEKGNRTPFTDSIGAKPSNAQGKLAHIPVNAVNALKSARTAVQKATENAPLWGENTALTAAKANESSILGSMISVMPDPELQGLLSKIISSPKAGSRSIDEIMQQLNDFRTAQDKSIDAKNQQIAREILTVALGRL